MGFANSLKAISSSLPITSRMFEPRVAVPGLLFTRYGISMLRIEENLPLANRKKDMTREQKYASLFERVFIEIFGVLAQAGSMNLLMDLCSKGLEKSNFLKVPTTQVLKQGGVDSVERDAINKAIRTVYGAEGKSKFPKAIIAEQIYDVNKLRGRVGLVRREVVKLLNEKGRTIRDVTRLPEGTRKAINKLLTNYNRKLMASAAISFIVGVLGCAFISGYLFQWLNDNVVAKRVIPSMNAFLGLKKPYHEIPLPGPAPNNVEQRTYRM